MKEKKERNWFFPVIMSIFFLFLLADNVVTHLAVYRLNQKLEAMMLPASPAILEVSQKEVLESNNPELTLDLAVVGSGEGITTVFARQLARDPEFEGDVSLEAWRIAVRAGYIDWKFGAGIGVKAPDEVAYVLVKDEEGKYSAVAKHVKDKEGNFSGSPESVQELSSTFAKADFLGKPGNVRIQTDHEFVMMA